MIPTGRESSVPVTRCGSWNSGLGHEMINNGYPRALSR